MIVNRIGDSFLKFSFADKVVALNPGVGISGKKVSKFGADIAIANLSAPAFADFSLTKGKNKDTFIIKSPGEYEISDIFIKGYGFKSLFDGKEYFATSYTLLMDGVLTACIAPIKDGKLFSNEAFEDFANCGLFVLPIGGGDFFDPKEAYDFVKAFEPKIIVPICYDKKEDLKEFASLFGLEPLSEPKLSLKSKDFDENATLKIVDLTY